MRTRPVFGSNSVMLSVGCAYMAVAVVPKMSTCGEMPRSTVTGICATSPFTTTSVTSGWGAKSSASALRICPIVSAAISPPSNDMRICPSTAASAQYVVIPSDWDFEIDTISL